MMNNRFAGELMSKINRLVEAGISIHTQIVCCPGYNDGEVLEQTYRDLEALAAYGGNNGCSSGWDYKA